MAISIDWGNTNVISILQSDLSFISGALYELDVNAFRLTLKDLEDDEEGMPWPNTHIHNTEVTVAGTTFARTVEIIAPYSLTFEDTGSAYSIRFVGANNNLFDVENNILNVTEKVSYIPTNSAGLVVTAISGLTPEELEKLEDIWTRIFGGTLYVDPVSGKEVVKDGLGGDYSEALIFSDEGTTPYDGTAGVAQRDPHVKP